MCGGVSAPVPTMASTGFSAFTDPQGSAVLADSPEGVLLSDPDEGANNVRTVCKSAPTPPYFIIARVAVASIWDNAGNEGIGIGWRDSGSGKSILHGLFNNSSGQNIFFAFNFTAWNNFSSIASNGGGSWLWGSTEAVLTLEDDGSNVTASFSSFIPSTSGGGAAQVPSGGDATFSYAKSGGFLGSSGYNQVCLMAFAQSSAVFGVLKYYNETTP
jgi:hypothetical protein